MKRIGEIDIAKKIAIIMVVVDHLYTTWNGLIQIIVFSYAISFIVSSILYSLQYDRNECIIFRYRKKA